MPVGFKHRPADGSQERLALGSSARALLHPMAALPAGRVSVKRTLNQSRN